MKISTIIPASLFTLGLLTGSASANNIQTSGVTLADLDTVTHTVNVQFNVQWENSWRVTGGPNNWDAAWLFVKFHTGDGNWRHASLSTVDGDHFAPAGSTINTGLTGSTGAGAFLYRSGPGTGNFTNNGVKLRWRYGADSVSDAALVTVDVSAIEMVYVPQGAFYLGDARPGAAYGNFYSGGSTNPFYVTNAGPMVCTNGLGKLWYDTSTNATAYTNVDVPTTFPNGFAAFYCMKYEPSQGERAAASNKGGPPVEYGGNNVTRQWFTGSPPNLVALTPNRAYSQNVGSGDTGNPYEFAYLDWVGLRPMTEFEYEKACRGPVAPVPGEYAWGTAVAASLPYTLTNDGTALEAIASGYNSNAGNAWLPLTRANISNGTCRVGIFALTNYAGTTSGRIQSGASYYGVMELTGNCSEVVVRWVFPAGYDTYGIFVANHGDGAISPLKYQNVPGWSNVNTLGSVSGVSFRGGDLKDGAFAVSERDRGAGSFTFRTVRGVRTAP